MSRRLGRRRALPCALLAILLGCGPWAGARADDDERLMPATVPPAYAQECGACHLAYPPALLPARAWQHLMGGLDRHYGSEASLDARTARQIEGWLLANAGTYRRVAEAPPEDRITRSAWFERKHREVDAATWRLPSVKSAANCSACHAGADRGRFDDDDLRLPEGLDARQRRAWHD